ncbi:MAG: anaerobic ribonucleoside-triphosphate reductase [Conexivisphaerales archaeon]
MGTAVREKLSIQASIRRVKTIFSVIASPSRLEVLKILNTKGPMTYSELKSLAGFKAKKESGKFAYHLRKLLRQSLIAQNRAERKYMLTALGRLVLNSAKQIEEQALLESGRLFVRSSKHKMEEFTTDRIIHSLVTEAGMPVELAQRVASEAESRIYKFQTAYLTAPLIRELVNSILIEEGFEEYRHRLSRLGMPVYDVTEVFEKVGQGFYGIEALLNETANSVLSEYLLLIQLPRDIVDSHLSGDLHLSNVGNWSLRPDVVFAAIDNGLINTKQLEGKFLFIPKLNSLNDYVTKLATINYLISREVGKEIYYCGFSRLVPDDARKNDITNVFNIITCTSAQGTERPHVTFEVNATDRNFIQILEGYLDYVKSTPMPMLGLAITGADKIQEVHLNTILDICMHNGVVSLNRQSRIKRSYYGVSAELDAKAGPLVLGSVSINMPRIALDAQSDEVYFRAKMRLQMQNAVNALALRKKLIDNNIKRGLLPSISTLNDLVFKDFTMLRINMTGLSEALALIDSAASPEEMVLETAESIKEYFRSIAEDGYGSFSVTLSPDESASRFVQLDRDKFGRSKVKGIVTNRYSQGMILGHDELNDKTKISYAKTLLNAIDGGVDIKFILNAGYEENTKDIVKALTMLDYIMLVPRLKVCSKCGLKQPDSNTRCQSCNGALITSYT